MVDIQSAAAEIRRGKKIEDRKKPQGKNIMSASATQGGHNKHKVCCCSSRSWTASIFPSFNTYGCRAFLVAGPTVWNSLPDFIRDPTVSADCFRRLLSAFEVL